ncbi:GDSL-type esterase/lipase family protein [Streptomyces zingiberis]|uniref:GDSL-type esterase/lipase family protein n=1 Tax=Streptomyces zingiberis TaxID=2053010 RepID=UPI002892EEAD|nr:GDSL-type esterase/lipase family protein [Streptomyces zingiberis]
MATPTSSPARPPEGGPGSLAALGDSMSRGFDACRLLADCVRASWATGTDPEVNSLATRLLADPRADSVNLARTGAAMADLPGQAERAVRHRPELVTVLMGANDACRSGVASMTPVESFRADFREALRTLREGLPETEVFVASVPDLYRLWEQGRGSDQAKQVWALGICPSMLAEPDAVGPAAVERRQAVRDRVVAYNRVLEEECGRDRRCRYDGGAVFRFRFTGAQLSPWDWFHPSREGQRRLAELAYRVIAGERPAG